MHIDVVKCGLDGKQEDAYDAWENLQCIKINKKIISGKIG